jgi:hypothetical protein
MPQLGRPRRLENPVAILVRVERWEREWMEELAAFNERSLTDETRAAIKNHLRGGGIDDRVAVNGRGAPRSR